MMNRIVNDLWLGGQEDANELVRDNPERITAILNVRGPDAYRPPGRDQSSEHPGKAYKWIPAPDIGLIYARQVSEALVWLGEQTAKGERILIHCKHGLSRSPAILAAFMVESGLSPSLDEAKAAILARRPAHFATQVVEPAKTVVLISALTGLPNRQAFDAGTTGRFVAIVDVSLMRMFNEMYGHHAGDRLLRRLADILIGVGLEAYHNGGDDFLCKGESESELRSKLGQAREIFVKPAQIYADGYLQTIEEMNFSFAIGATWEQAKSALVVAKRTTEEPPEWLRKVIGRGGQR